MSLRERFSAPLQNQIASDDWLIAREAYNPDENLHYETLFCLANGYMGNRGVFEEGGVRKTLPANLVHGVFDRSEAFMRELANTPDWTGLRVGYELERLGIEDCASIEEFLCVMDLKSGALYRRSVLRSADGKRTLLESQKFLSRAHENRAAIRLFLTPLNYGGLFAVESTIDATVTNFADSPRFRVKHMQTTDVGTLDGKGTYVQVQTRDFGLPVGTGARTLAHTLTGEDIKRSARTTPFGEVARELFDIELEQGQTAVIDKLVCLYTGRETQGVRAAVSREMQAFLIKGFEGEFAEHTAGVQALWDRADIRIEGDAPMQTALRFTIFHLMSTPNPHDSTVNIGAKLLHGEEYGGHAFWDTELFMLPFFTWVFPEVARNLVSYRHHLLDAARRNARMEGYRGAKYPWESADTGEEECPAWTIDPDGTCYRCMVADYEHHVTADVAMGICQYVDTTADRAWMARYGIEILAETARFWASRVRYNPQHNHYEILSVTGPDEWHEPVDNNTYTNRLAKWNIERALMELERLSHEDATAYGRLCETLQISPAELAHWKGVADALFVRNKAGLVEQFDGYFQLNDVWVTEWDEKGMPKRPAAMSRYPRGSTTIMKQADVLMLMFLLGGEYDLKTQRENYDYYEIRTLHRSSLSPSIHCIMGLRVGDAKRAYEYLKRSAFVDLYDSQGNTREGLHAASAGGTWQAVTMGFCGMDMDGERPAFRPQLPAHWNAVEFTIVWRGRTLDVRATADDVHVQARDGQPVNYRVNGMLRSSGEQV